MAMKTAPVLCVAGDARGATCACPSRIHKQGCAVSVRRPRLGTFYEMLHTATLAPFSNPKTNPRRTGRQLPARSAIDRDEVGNDGLCGMEDELVHGYRESHS